MISKPLHFFLATVATFLSCSFSHGQANAQPLQTFTIQEQLSHRWNNEIVHFDFNVASSNPLKLTDDKGNRVPAQFSRWVKKDKRTSGTVWTVVSLPPGGKNVFHLKAAQPQEKEPESDLKVVRDGAAFILGNGEVAVKVPQWPGGLKEPMKLEALPAPIQGVRSKQGEWLGEGAWFNDGEELQVREASTVVLEQGPVRAMLRQKVTLVDGRYYTLLITLGSRQEVATIREESNINSPKAGWRFSMSNGLHADRVFWHNQWAKSDHAETWSLTDTEVSHQQENVIATLRPWSFWWQQNLTMWAGFYQRGSEPFVGVMMMHPSKWAPWGEEGFSRTQVPITSRVNGALDLTFALASYKKKLDRRDITVLAEDSSVSPGIPAIGEEAEILMRREWGLTAGSVKDHVMDVQEANKQLNDHKAAGVTKLRFQLLKYGEFPLDEVKDYGFDIGANNKKPTNLLFTRADIERVRRQAKTVPAVKAQVDAALWYISTTGGPDHTLKTEGERAFYTKHYWGNGLTEKLPEAYEGSDDPIYGQMMAAAVKNLAADAYIAYLEVPGRPSLGSYGPWCAEDFMRLLFSYELIADTDLLSPQDKLAVQHALVFGAQFLGKKDYWDLNRGLASGNPNMTSMIQLPKGLLGLYLVGHPKSALWVTDAEEELKFEIEGLVASAKNDGEPSVTGMWPGAFYECPAYQTNSLDGIMLMATALRNVRGVDYFANPAFKATMDYWGYLNTPPDRRFPPQPNKVLAPTLLMPNALPPGTLPSIGDATSGALYPYSGLMAAATAKTDPEYSKRQQFYWKEINYHYNSGNRAAGFTLLLSNAEEGATPPAELQRGFPGFGSVARTSWTDPKATYLVHRTGAYNAHYHDDSNSFVLYSKGSPLALDFGNQYQPERRDEAWFHNRVSFDSPKSGKRYGANGELLEVTSLPATLDYSYGKAEGSGLQQDHRYMMLVKSADPMGANYVVIRDTTADGQGGQQFWFNLWCLAKDAQVQGNTVHFPGQYDIDLDAHILSPANPEIEKDHWKWEHYIGSYGNFAEEQYGIHVRKSGSDEDFLTVLYPRGTGQAPAKVSALEGGAAMRIAHMEGVDVVLLSPGKSATVKDAEFSLQGEIAFARAYQNGAVRLAVVKGDSSAAYRDWSIASNGAVSVEVQGGQVKGESAGTAHEVRIIMPANTGEVAVTLDGKPHPSKRDGKTLILSLPAGAHTFAFNVGA